MKILIIMSILLSNTLFAGEQCTTETISMDIVKRELITTDVPNFLKGATITVKLADGKETTVPAELFKVVPRKQQVLVTVIKQNDKTICSTSLDKNRVSLLAGRGAREGLNRDNYPTVVDVESKVGAIGGVQYQRVIKGKLSIGAQVQSNDTALVNIGLDF